jgi:hypothetical protein
MKCGVKRHGTTKTCVIHDKLTICQKEVNHPSIFFIYVNGVKNVGSSICLFIKYCNNVCASLDCAVDQSHCYNQPVRTALCQLLHKIAP